MAAAVKALAAADAEVDMRQHAFNFQYGGGPDFTAALEQAQQRWLETAPSYAAADPEMVLLSEEVTTVHPAQVHRKTPIRRAQEWLMDANQDEEVSRGEMKVFGLGVLTGYIVKRILG